MHLIILREWTCLSLYESLLEKNRLEFTDVSTCKEEPQSNENLQITIEELRHWISAIKTGKFFRPEGITLELVKCREHLVRHLL